MLIGIRGKATSGKTTTARIFRAFDNEIVRKDYENEDITCYTIINMGLMKATSISNIAIESFANPLKDMLVAITGKDRMFFTEAEYKNEIIDSKVWGESMTYRKLMQVTGDIWRNAFGKDIWIKKLFSRYAPVEVGKERKKIYPRWIIDDVRFDNEVEAVKERGGLIVRVNRPSLEAFDGNSHISETSIDNSKYDDDFVINNNGDLDNLVAEVKKMYDNYTKKGAL